MVIRLLPADCVSGVTSISTITPLTLCLVYEQSVRSVKHATVPSGQIQAIRGSEPASRVDEGNQDSAPGELLYVRLTDHLAIRPFIRLHRRAGSCEEGFVRSVSVWKYLWKYHLDTDMKRVQPLPSDSAFGRGRGCRPDRTSASTQYRPFRDPSTTYRLRSRNQTLHLDGLIVYRQRYPQLFIFRSRSDARPPAHSEYEGKAMV